MNINTLKKYCHILALKTRETKNGIFIYFNLIGPYFISHSDLKNIKYFIWSLRCEDEPKAYDLIDMITSNYNG